MKKYFRLLTTIVLILTIFVHVFGQNAPQNEKPNVASPFNEGQGYLTLGLDVGLSYQSSDVKAAFGGYGIGVTLEKNLKHTTGSALDLGVRGRLMYALSKGYNLTPSTGVAGNPAVNGTYNPLVNYTTEGSYFANHRTDQAELGIEAVLTLNRLRERTGVYATLFGGFGFNYYDVKIDQLDGNGKKYNYSTLKPNTIADVKGFLDGTFETKAEGFNDSAQFVFMPNLGLEIGYHFSPRFMVVLGHKVTFTKTDLFDGQRWLDKTNLTAKPDFHNYTSLQFKWILGERKRQTYDGDPPKITILQPRLSPYNTYDGIETIRAEVLGVTFQEDITVTVNGLQTNFTYKNNDVTSDVMLKKGENEIIVKAENPNGSSFKKLVINVLEKQKLPDPPIVVNPTNNNNNNNPTTPTTQSPRVKFLTPASYSETERDRQAIRVQIDNVPNAQDVTLTVNGRSYNDFRYSYGELTHNVLLNEGQNSIVVSARNSAGSSSDAATVNYRRPVQRVDLPIVRINSTGNPTENTYGGCQTAIEARVDNVAGQRDITMSVNGRSFTDFNYNYSTRILRANVSLASGSNQIAIRARNEAGEGNDRADVNCAQRQSYPPTVRISQPANNTTVDQKTVDVRATTANVASKNEIAVFVNGYQTSDFSYYPFDKSVTTRINLTEGENNVRIRVTNNDGSNEDMVRFTYRPRVVSSPPRVTIAQPSNGANSKIPTTDLQANTSGVTNRNQVQVTVNFKNVSNFNFEPTTGIITARLALDAGANTIKVIVSNESGSDATTTTVNHSRPVIVEAPRPPHVTIMRPTDGTTTATPSVLLEAQVDNASAARNEVKLYVNGAEIAPAMNVMRQIRQTINLIEGVNTITLRATNKDGTDEKTVRVTYVKTPIPPVKKDRTDVPVIVLDPSNDAPMPTITNFNVTQPVTDPFDPKPLVSVVTATIAKAQKGNVQFKVNGEDVTTFEYNESTGQFRYSFGIKSGQSYTFYIRAYNLDGQAEKTETVKF